MVPPPVAYTAVIIGLGRDCLDAFRFVDGLIHSAQRAETSAAMLLIEQTKFRVWLHSWGITERKSREADSRYAIPQIEISIVGEAVKAALHRIKDRLGDGALLMERYGLKNLNAESAEMPTVMLSELDIANKPEEKSRPKSLGFAKRLRWQIDDDQKFQKLIADLHYFIAELFNLLPPPERHIIDEGACSSVLEDEHDIEVLASMSKGSGDIEDKLIELAQLKTFARMLEPPTWISTEGSSPDMVLQMKLPRNALLLPITLARQSRKMSIAEISTPEGRQRVLVEWRRINPTWTEDVRDLMWRRFDGIAQLLRRSSEIDACFRTLACRGFVVEPALDYVAFVSQMPAGSSQDGVPLMLSQLLKGDVVPNLEVRFAAARAIAIAVHQIHATGWLHKNIRSNNIIFFSNSDEAAAVNETLARPFICGFGNSRVDHPQEATEKPIELTGSDFDIYSPPEYGPGTRYERCFDIYSLGVVLFELAMWEPAEKYKRLDKSGKDDAVKYHQRLKRRSTQMLGAEVGSMYKEVVLACLDAPRTVRDGDSWFFWDVVRQLDKCKA